jgi:hypothetical protein
MATNIPYPHCAATGGPLPRPDIRYGGAIDSFVARTKMDTGEFRQRARYSRQQEIVTIVLSLTHEEMDFFRNWMLYTLAQGTLSFNMDLPLGGNISNPFVSREVRIIEGKWKHKYQSHLHHKVTFRIEFLDTATLSADIFSVYTDLGTPNDPCDQFDLAAFEAAVDTLDIYTRDILPEHIDEFLYDIDNLEIEIDTLDVYTRDTLPVHLS